MRVARHELKFTEPLPELVLDYKGTTWRLNNTREFHPGDELRLIHRPSLRLFGIATVCSSADRTFATLQPEDYEGHEPFRDQEEMLRTYAGYYAMDVTLETPLTVVKFQPWLLCSNPGSDETDIMIKNGFAA